MVSHRAQLVVTAVLYTDPIELEKFLPFKGNEHCPFGGWGWVLIDIELDY